MDDLGIEGQVQEQARVLSPFLRRVTWISKVGVAISAIALGCIMLISVADIAGRNLFKHPIQGTSEIVGLLLVVTASLGLGWCQLLKGNVKIDILYNRLSARWQAIMDVLSNLMSIAIAFIITWRGTLMMLDYMTRKFGSTTADLNLKMWPFILVMALGFGWVTFIFLIDLFESVKRAVSRCKLKPSSA